MRNMHRDGEAAIASTRDVRATQAVLIYAVMCKSVLHMRETLTISLPRRLRRDLEKVAKAEGVTSSDAVITSVPANLARSAGPFSCGLSFTRRQYPRTATECRPYHWTYSWLPGFQVE